MGAHALFANAYQYAQFRRRRLYMSCNYYSNNRKSLTTIPQYQTTQKYQNIPRLENLNFLSPWYSMPTAPYGTTTIPAFKILDPL